MVDSATGTNGNKVDGVGTVDDVPWEGVFVRVTWAEQEFGKLRIQQARKQENYCRVSQMEKMEVRGVCRVEDKKSRAGT